MDSSSSKKIPLTKGRFAIVDEDDYEWLMQWKWCYRFNGNDYAIRGIRTPESKKGNVTRTTIQMHRAILKTPNGMHTDHINGNGLDNRKSNLRICTQSQNLKNQKKRKGSSKYKGVSWCKIKERWVVQIQSDNIKKHIGYFLDENEASEAYNKAALAYHNEFARINAVS